MVKKYNPGDTAFLIESNRFIREITVLNNKGSFYTIRFADSGGAIKVRESRLFATKEEAESSLSKGAYK